MEKCGEKPAVAGGGRGSGPCGQGSPQCSCLRMQPSPGLSLRETFECPSSGWLVGGQQGPLGAFGFAILSSVCTQEAPAKFRSVGLTFLPPPAGPTVCAAGLGSVLAASAGSAPSSFWK